MFFFPLINDVTTTPLEPPAFVALAQVPANAGRDMRYPPGNALVQQTAYPDLAPLSFADAPDLCFAKASAAAHGMSGWEVAAEDAKARRIEAVATTAVLRFKDDVVVEVRQAGTGCAVHMRSKSRLGRGDMGANAKRIRKFLALLSGRRP